MYLKILTKPKVKIFLLKDGLKNLAKEKVDTYLDLTQTKGYKSDQISIDHQIVFLDARNKITFKIDIVVYNQNLKPYMYIVLDRIKTHSKEFNLIVKHFFNAVLIEGQTTVKYIVIVNPYTNKVVCINYKKYPTYKIWENSKYTCLNYIPKTEFL